MTKNYYKKLQKITYLAFFWPIINKSVDVAHWLGNLLH